MAEYNPSKIIKDGNTYNFRDTTKIPLAGSNQISGSLIPSTDGTVNLGSASYQWNNAYIKSLTINGVACGDILTHNASEFVNVSSNQTIGGQKTFTASPRVTRIFPDIALNISDCDVTEIPTEAKYASLFFRDKNNKNLAYITGQQRLDGKKRMCLRIHRTDNINNYYSIDLDSDGDFYPEQNNTLRLGTPALQWNKAYTRNILIDNDINIASSLINKTSTSGVISIRSGINTQDGASIGLYGKDYNGGIAGNIYMTAYGNSDYTNFRIYPNGTISVYNNSTATTKNVAMQEDVVNLTTAQTIGGVKTFTSSIGIVKDSGDVELSIKNTSLSLKANTNSGMDDIRFTDKDNLIVGGLRQSFTNSKVIGMTYSRSYSSDGNSYTQTEFTLVTDNQNGISDAYVKCDNFYPNANATINLGTSTNKWKSFNGVNPGALSLPSNSYVNVDTTNWDLTCQNELMGSFTPTADGWLMLHVANSGSNEVAFWIIGGVIRINNKSSINTTDNNNFNMFTIPVEKDVTYNIYGNASEYVAGRSIRYCRFMPCRGNI